LVMSLILAYGMVNFNSGAPDTSFAFPKAQAVSHVDGLPAQPQPLPADQLLVSRSDVANANAFGLPEVQQDQKNDIEAEDDDSEVEPRKR